MKTKKFRKHEFRYLAKKHVRDPMDYIHTFYTCETNIRFWKRDIHLLVNAAACPEMQCPGLTDTAYVCRQLIEQVEAAFVIFRLCNLAEQPFPLKFFATREDYVQYIDHGKYTFNGKVDPLDTISKFFSYQTLEGWYGTLDDLWMGLAAPENEYNDRFGDRVVADKELLIRLAQAMYDLLDWPGIPVPEDGGGPDLPPAMHEAQAPPVQPEKDPVTTPEKPLVAVGTVCIPGDFALLWLPCGTA